MFLLHIIYSTGTNTETCNVWTVQVIWGFGLQHFMRGSKSFPRESQYTSHMFYKPQSRENKKEEKSVDMIFIF